MKIQALSNQNFGKIFIENGIEKRLYNEIHMSSGPTDAYKEVITDILDVQSSPKDHVYIRKDGSIEAKCAVTDYNMSKMCAPTFLQNFFLALRTARSERYQSYLSNFQENNLNPIDV